MYHLRIAQVQAGIFACLLTLLAAGTAQARPTGWDGHAIVSISVADQADLDTLVALDAASRDFEIWSDGVGIGLIDVRVSPDQRLALDASGLTYTVITEDLQRQYDLMFGGPRGGDFFDTYRSYDEHVTFMNDLVAAYPDLAQMVDLGTSVLGRSMWALRITGPDGGDKPAVMYNGAQHGNEVIGPCIIAYTAE